MRARGFVEHVCVHDIVGRSRTKRAADVLKGFAVVNEAAEVVLHFREAPPGTHALAHVVLVCCFKHTVLSQRERAHGLVAAVALA